MSFWIKICSLIVLLFFISSCADYKPVIDFRGSEKKGADLERYDDDLSSCKKLAKQTIIEFGIKKSKRRNKSLIDQVSATIILQSYLELIKHQK